MPLTSTILVLGMTRHVREALGSALAASDLTWARDGEERGVDRIVASAWTGTELGRTLARLKYAGERTSATLLRALQAVVERVAQRRGGYGRARQTIELWACCAAAIDEWMNDTCGHCHGRAYVRLDATPRACGTCAGTGRIQWTEEARAEKLGGTYDRKLYERVLQRLQEADHRHHNETRRGLAP